MSLLLGIDVGTTNVKAIAFDQEGRVRARASHPTPTVHEGRGRALHDAEELWETASQLVRQVTGQVGTVTIAGVAVASMGEEGFPLDERGGVLYPGILWHDERTLPLVSWWEREVGVERVYRLTGLPISHNFTALKLQWLYRNEPEVMRRAARWLWVSDYIAFRLSGALATTPSLASRTMLYELAANTWSSELLAGAGVPGTLLPPIVNSGTIIGTVTAAAASATGLPAGTPVAAGGHDHICGFLAAGAIEAEDVIHSGGTAEALARILARQELEGILTTPDELSCGAHVVPGQYYQEKGRYTGAMIGWWERLLAGGESPGALRAEAAAAPPGSNGLIFLPYMFGKAAPGVDPMATGSLLGLTADHTRGDVMRAVVEGVCYDTVELQRLLRPGGARTVTVIGGLAYNRLWLRLKAAILDMEVRVPEQREAVAQGAALLAGLGAGVYREPGTMLRHTLRFEEVVEPEPEAVALYGQLYENHYRQAAEIAGAVVGR